MLCHVIVYWIIIITCCMAHLGYALIFLLDHDKLGGAPRTYYYREVGAASRIQSTRDIIVR